SSDPWFDAECRAAKRLTRRLERAYIAAAKRQDSSLPSVEAVWISQRRSYRDLRQQKRHSFWQKTIYSSRHSPRDLWRTIDKVLGRGRLKNTSEVTVDQFVDAIPSRPLVV